MCDETITITFEPDVKGEGKDVKAGKALDHANKASVRAPPDAANTAMYGNIARLKDGKNINQ